MFLGAALLVLAARVAAADPSGVPTAPSSGDIRVVEPAGAGASTQGVARGSRYATPEEQPSDTPTPAKHHPASEENGKATAVKPKSADDQPKAKPADDSLSPVADPQEGPPAPLEAASFKGVVPGTSTKDDVASVWGQPRRTSKANGALVQLYSVEPFKRVEVNYTDGKVSSVVIRLDRPFPAEAVAKQLGLTAVRPVLVVNDLGEVLGRAYPERGVLLAFEPSDKPGKASMKVSQIVLEPISAEAFVLRAETTLESRNDLSGRDLEQALILEPGNARANWLYSRVMAATDQHDKAVAAAGEAVRLEPDNAQYRVTHAQALAQAGQLPEAVAEARKAVAASEGRPHVKARATCLVGDLLASGPKPDFKQALTLHMQALKLADAIASDPHPAIRMAAKEVMIDAYLGGAHDVAWGEWKDKPKAVVRWLDRAKAVAEDIVANEGGSQEQLFHVYVRALAAYVGMRNDVDPAPTAKALIETGKTLVAAARDPGQKARLQWEIGMALYDAVQICQARSESDNTLKFGEVAAGYMADAIKAKPAITSTFLLGRLYFRLGAIHSMHNHDHKAAVVWFDKAVPLLERATPEELADDLGRQGEAFVGMGASYWNIGRHDEGLALTKKGIKWMEQAVKQGTLDRAALADPYSNLAAMHQRLGANDLAKRFQDMASRAKGEKLK
jgi:tetratricopeptide (TPR) repeat protein